MDKISSKATSVSASKDQWTNPIEFLMTCIGMPKMISKCYKVYLLYYI
jgi:hypothetical protein